MEEYTRKALRIIRFMYHGPQSKMTDGNPPVQLRYFKITEKEPIKKTINSKIIAFLADNDLL